MNTLTNTFKTAALLAALGGLLVFIGGLLGGQTGMVMALVFAIALNGFVYWKSDTLALKANGARELGLGEAPRLRQIVTELSRRADIPVPRIYLVDRPEPNAFATGRDPDHSAIAVTSGLLELVNERQLTGVLAHELSHVKNRDTLIGTIAVTSGLLELVNERQLTGVLAHELSHVKNRDTLIGTIAATIGGAISFLAQMAQFQLIFGGGDDENGGNPFGALVAIILAPIAAMIIQLAVSRGREYYADSSGASLTGDPEGLAQALEQLEAANKSRGLLGRFRRSRGEPAPAPAPAANPAFAHLYIVNPLAGVNIGGLFSTHPPIPDRVRRLRSMAFGRAA
jgi:heat shock protein HtpX